MVSSDGREAIGVLSDGGHPNFRNSNKNDKKKLLGHF